MKHRIVVAVCLAVIIAVSTLSISVWHDRRVQEKIHDTKIALEQAYQRQVTKARVTANYNKLNATCHKAQATYDLSTKKVGARPECDLQIVQ